MSSGSSVVGEPLPEGAPLDAGDGGAWRRYGVVALFLGPAAIFLIVWVVYPTVYTIGRSFFGRNGFQDFVWFDNYKSLFSDHVLRTAIKNNVIWVAVVPALVTAIGLVFAVLTERIRWSVAFKTAVFMPMAISLFATGVIWRLMDQEDPQRGTVNAVIGVFHDAVRPPGVLTDASPSTETLTGTPQTGLTLKVPVRAGAVVPLGLTGHRARGRAGRSEAGGAPAGEAGRHHGCRLAGLQAGRRHARKGRAGRARLAGSAGRAARRGREEGADGEHRGDDGAFAFDGVESGSYRPAIGLRHVPARRSAASAGSARSSSRPRS